MFKASEYLAIKLLNETSCTLDSDLSRQLETYRAMKKGNTAPEIVFKGDIIALAYGADNFPSTLSDIKSQYSLIVFGASWCPKCTKELPEIVKMYSKWKASGIEVVFVSLDEDKELFTSFAATFPFVSCLIR